MTTKKMKTVEPVQTLAQEIGARLACLRGGRTQREWARDIAVSHSCLQRYEAGESAPRAEVLVRIAAAEGVTTDWILTGMPPRLRKAS